MLINVATLLQEPLGTARSHQLEDEPVAVPAEGYARRISGRVDLMRIARGVLVRAMLSTVAALECGRCLALFDAPMTIEIDDEYVTEHDPQTGQAHTDIAPDDFRIGADQHLDLSEAVRQYEQATLPLRPVCSPDCAGLCQQCGQDLNRARCQCTGDETQNRWSSLAGLADRLRVEERVNDGTEESDGGSQA